MASDNFMIPPVERNLKPLVVRRSGVQDYQPQKEKEHSGRPGSDRKGSERDGSSVPHVGGCIVSDHKIDCKI